MDRRQFTCTLGVFSGGSMFSGNLGARRRRQKCKQLIKVAPLKTGATIGLISPASAATSEQYARAIKHIETLGLNIKHGKFAKNKYGYLGGKDEERLSDLHAMFRDKEVDAIWCVRGGYGCARLLPHLDYKLIRQNPKAIIGYSDITALLIAIYQHTGMVGFHGPLAFSDYTDYTLKHLKATLFEEKKSHQISLVDESIIPLEVIKPGKARGRLLGGNLSLLASMMGTPFQPDYKNKLVFIEDVGEKPYRIDRMLTQLLQGGLKDAAGILLGTFADCEAKPGDNSLTLSETLRDCLGNLKMPVVYGLSFGHVSDQFTLPVGVMAEMDAKSGQLTLLESGLDF